MPSALPILSGREVVRVFETFGWQVARQSASHIIMVKGGEQVTLSVRLEAGVGKVLLRSGVCPGNRRLWDNAKLKWSIK
jgi:predicted RNA binding protein YcfA (HicA-like mRNA interferase family)